MPLANRIVVPVFAILGGLLLAALFVHLGPSRILSLVMSLRWNFLVIVSLFGAHEIVRTLAIRGCLPSETRPPLGELLFIRFVGEAAGALTRTGSLAAEPARAWLLANRSGRPGTGYSAAAAELLANSATSAAINVAVAGWILLTADFKGPVLILAHVLFWGSLIYFSAVVGIVASRGLVLRGCARVASAVPLIGPRLQPDASKLRNMQQAVGIAYTQRRAALARILLLEIAAQTLLVCEVFWILRSMSAGLALRSALYIEVMTRALTAIEVAGATEMGFAVVFTWLGMPAAVGFSLSLVKTLRSLAAAGIGIVLLRGANRRDASVPCRRSRTAALASDG